MGALAPTVATHVTDACQTCQTKRPPWRGGGRPSKSALSRAETVQGNSQRALDHTLNRANKRGEELETVRGAVKEAEEGRQKAEVWRRRRCGGGGMTFSSAWGWLRRRCAASPPPSVPPTPPSRGWVH